ncbi:ATP synthase mitochondrial F1 complex assembly factor 2-like isoform X2 [Oryctolagus cuniculus]|uniref:ATP synthase mitochondrial F1 complex assembly factor 2-like isoform X2 n=1 Tax=Oryctolagus cuniculus TaxID=9986 RepID=UPI0038795F0A
MASSGLRTFGHLSPLSAARPSSLSRRLILRPGCRCCFFFFFFFGVCTGPVCLPCCPLSDRRAGATSLALLTSDSQPLAGSLVGTWQISEPVWVRPGCQRPRCLCAKGARWKSRSVRSVSHSCLRVLFTVSDRPGPQSLTSVKWTTLCNTSLDNPTQRSKDQLIRAAIKFLDTDTICYRVEEPETLVELQKNEWDPVIEWAENRYGVEIGSSTSIMGPSIPARTHKVLANHLASYNMWALQGIEFVVTQLKSMVLTLGLTDLHLTVEQAALLSRLEEEYQIQKWGNVEWAHDYELQELRARTAAGTLFIHLCSQSSTVKHKLLQE